jgi:hypothetical protein
MSAFHPAMDRNMKVPILFVKEFQKKLSAAHEMIGLT